MDRDQLDRGDTAHEETFDELADLLLDLVFVDGRAHDVLPIDGSDGEA
jgi:hypothetical protein